MNYKVGNKYHGFILKHEEDIEEINSKARVFEHEITGAKLLHIENDDDNKVFSIGFKTPPKDDTGVAHILEHSVLCGSRKFPTKEPFVELIKGSLNTFLNAMTFGDKTIYPIASRNEKDFFNLMDVYLDAVFYPNIYSIKEILMQEGWHYNLEDKDDELTYKGVVYNEMKGAFSSPDGILMRKVQETLFPDNTYGFESGGDPDHIPELTYEEFLAFHTKYYHPSNSYIFLYGNGNIDKMLEFINRDYLCNFDKKHIDAEIKPQAPYKKMKEVVEEYSISEEDSQEEKTFLSLNFVTGESVDEELYFALDILEYILLDAQGAPLKKAILDAEIGKDVYGSFDNGILQPVFSIVVKNSEENKKDKFKKVVFETLNDLVENGIDKKLIEGCVNITEFRLREADLQGFPKGLFYYLTAMDSWLYGGDPLMHIRYGKTLDKIKSAQETKYFENLINKYLINNSHSSVLILKPNKGLAHRKEVQLQTKLKNYKEKLSNEELEKIITETKELTLRQTTPDTKEVLETIPVLSLEDIDKKVEDMEVVNVDLDGMKILNHNIFTSKIAYISFMFNGKVVKEEDICYLSLLGTILGKVDTKKYNYAELSNEILINTGGIYFKTEVYGDDKKLGKYYPYLEGHCKVMVDKLPKALDILADIIENSLFEDEKRIRELIRQLISRIEMKLIDRGHQVVLTRLSSYFSPASLYIEKTSGYEFYKFLKDLEENFDNRIINLKKRLYEITKEVFNRNNLIVGLTGSNNELEALKKNLSKVTNILEDNTVYLNEYEFIKENKNEGLLTPSNVQYVAKGYNYKELGYEYNGKMMVLKTIIGLDYLWNKIRVQGGAYGAFANIVRSGNIAFASYRDPNLKETLEAYDEVYKFIENFQTSDREMTKYIIGTISELDMPLTPSMKGDKAISMYIRGISKEDRQKEREEIINTKVEDINSYSKLLNEIMREDFIAVLGNDKKIKENETIFKNLINVFN